jgi:hypothetical protein
MQILIIQVKWLQLRNHRQIPFWLELRMIGLGLDNPDISNPPRPRPRNPGISMDAVDYYVTAQILASSGLIGSTLGLFESSQ